MSSSPAEAKPRGGGGPGSKLAFLLYFGANLAPRFAMLASMLVLTRLLPLAEYGLLALVVTTGECLESITATWIRLLLMRTEAGHGAARRGALHRARRLTLGAVLVSAAIAVPVGILLEGDRAAAFAGATIAYVVSFALLRFLLTLLQIGERHAAYHRIELLRTASIVAATILGPLIDSGSFLPTSLAMSGGAALIAVWGLLQLPAPAGRKTRRLRLGPALAFGAPIVLSFTVTLALRSAGQYALEAVLGLAAVGIYAAASGLARQPVELVTGALNTYTYPLLLRRQASAGPLGVAEAQTGILLTVTALGAGLVALTFAVAEPVVALILPEAYRAASAQIMPWVALGTFGFAVKQFVFDNCFHVTKRNWLQLASSAVPAALGIAVTIGFVAAYGLAGAGPAYAVISGLSLAVSAVASRRVLAFPVPLPRIAGIAVSAALAGGVAWAAGPVLSAGGTLGVLVGSASIFAGLYLAALACVGFSITRLIAVPWDPLRPRRAGSASAPDLTGARP